MNIQNQFNSFYRPYIDKICQSIKEGKVLILVGINSIGKTLLTLQLQSGSLKKTYLENEKVKFVYLEFKDKNPPTTQQLYKYWLTQTAKVLNYPLPQKETFNDFSFYSHLSETVRKLKTDEKLVFIILDAQNILNQGEAFYKALLYLHRFTYRKVSYIFLSEPQILNCQNVWVQRFIQDSTNNKFHFLKLFDKPAILADIIREEEFLKTKLTQKHQSLILKYCGGLHGVIGALAYFLKNNPQVKDIRQLRKIVFNDQMYRYWIEDIFNSLPDESIRILKEVINDRNSFSRLRKNIFGKWLIDLGFLKKNGVFRHPMIIPLLKSYSAADKDSVNKLRLSNNQFFFGKEKIRLTKNEKRVLVKLFKAKGELVTYDKIGEELWKEDPDKFSLWAISQIVRRLRKKLSFYSINPKIITSLRGEGYQLN